MNLKETTIVQGFLMELEKDSIAFPQEGVSAVFGGLVAGTVAALKSIFQVTKEESKLAAVIDNAVGEIQLGAIGTFTPGEDGNAGNWSVEFSFNPEDFKDVKCITLSSGNLDMPISHQTANYTGEDLGVSYDKVAYLKKIVTTATGALIQWLDTNAKEGEEVSVSVPNYFEASVAIVDGQKVMSLEPFDKVTKLIKDDTKEEA